MKITKKALPIQYMHTMGEFCCHEMKYAYNTEWVHFNPDTGALYFVVSYGNKGPAKDITLNNCPYCGKRIEVI